MSSLRLIHQETQTSASSRILVEDVFTSDYSIYKIVTSKFETVGSDATALDMRFLSTSGTEITNTNYEYACLTLKAETTFSERTGSNKNYLDNAFGGTDESPSTNMTVTYVYNPYEELYTAVTMDRTAITGTTSSNVSRGEKFIGLLKQTRRMGGFMLYETNSRPFQNGVIKVYGFRID